MEINSAPGTLLNLGERKLTLHFAEPGASNANELPHCRLTQFFGTDTTINITQRRAHFRIS